MNRFIVFIMLFVLAICDGNFESNGGSPEEFIVSTECMDGYKHDDGICVLEYEEIPKNPEPFFPEISEIVVEIVVGLYIWYFIVFIL
ncbi:unnamed protein product [Caenorhabditis brenneri]